MILRCCKECKEDFLWKKGQGIGKYCSRLCACRARNTLDHQRKAGKIGGAFNIKLRGTGTKTYVKELGRHQHRVVMERTLGRKLVKGEIVHHKDRNKKNNHPSNLEVMTQSQHARLHNFGR